MISSTYTPAWKTMMLKLFASVLLVASVAACKSYDPQRVEKDFGNSVRQMIEEQTASPALVPATVGPDRLDGVTAVETVENYQATAKQKRLTKGATSGLVQ